ncbi:MAG: sugar ABC transporter permease [Chloroflexi bacterium]|nr:sugar ABC transporter permease [Chloroflexota bacterium]
MPRSAGGQQLDSASDWRGVSVTQAAPPAARQPSRSRWIIRFVRRRAFREALVGYALLLPGAVPMLIFLLAPIFAGFFFSLLKWNLLQPWTFVGVENYATLFGDPELWEALQVSATYMVGVIPAGIVISLALAVALNTGRRGIIAYRTLYFMPVVTATVAIALLWRWLYAGQIGLLNTLLASFGIQGPDWLGDPAWALPAVMIMSVWKGLGYTMVLFLAGLQGIPEHLYDAARIDGAGTWARFRYVTLPLLSPTTFFVLVTGLIGALQVFDQIFVMTNGGPYRSTVSASFYIYETGFRLLKMGYAAAAAWMLFAIIFVATLIQWRLQERWVHYE